MNLKDFFEEYGVEYWTSGKNVAKGCINITCMFCGDTSNHLGIRKSDFRSKCWRCGRHYFGNIVKNIVGCTLKEAKKIIKTLEAIGPVEDESSENKNTKSPFNILQRAQLPPEATKEFPSIHLRYLKDRGFNPRKIIRKYNLYACYNHGNFKFRIIIPIYRNKILVAYTSRDVTDEQDLRYKEAKVVDCVLDPAQLIYNFDSIKPYKDAFCVEGPTDVWRMGDGSFCFLGVIITPKRILELAEKKIDNLYLLYDNDKVGRRESKKVANILSPIANKTHILKLNKYKDPAKLKNTQVEEIKRVINFNY